MYFTAYLRIEEVSDAAESATTTTSGGSTRIIPHCALSHLRSIFSLYWQHFQIRKNTEIFDSIFCLLFHICLHQSTDVSQIHVSASAPTKYELWN